MPWLRSAVACVLVAACGESAGPPSDGGTIDVAPRPSQGGSVLVTASAYTVQEKVFAETRVGAQFTTDASCTDVVEGACVTRRCSGTPTERSAGPITVQGLTGGDEVLAGAPYPTRTSATQRFLGGETLGATFAGDAVPGATRSVVAPDFVTLTLPSWAPSATLSIPRSSDLVLTWDGGNRGTAFVELSDGAVSVRCEAKATSAKMSVPAKLLAPLAKASTFQFGTVARDARDVGAWRVDFVVTALASRGGAVAAGPVSID